MLMWKILEMACDEEIINVRIENDKLLKWDFKVGSPYELCAIFPYRQNGRLEEFEIRGIRPILYHKKMKLSHIIPESRKAEGYCLFPATIHEGILYIARQKKGNIRYPTKQSEPVRVIHLTEQRQKKHLGKMVVDYQQAGVWTLKNIRWNSIIYYKIWGVDDLYLLHISEKENMIILQDPNLITFYKDIECEREIGEKEFTYESSIVRKKHRGIFKNSGILRESVWK